MTLPTIIENAAKALQSRAEATAERIRRVEEEDRARPLSGMDRDEIVARIKEHPVVYVPSIMMVIAMWLAPYAAAAAIGVALGQARLWWVTP